MPALTLTALVSARGAHTWYHAPTGNASIEVELAAWRLPGRPIDTRRFSLYRHGNDFDPVPISRRLKPGTVVRLRADIDPDTREPACFGTFVALLRTGLNDPGLSALTGKLARPRRLRDDVLGTLTWDPDATWWTARPTFAGRRVRIYLPTRIDPEAELPPALETARAVFRAQRRWSDRLTRHAAEHTLRACRALLPPPERPTRTGYRRLLRISTLSFFPDRRFEAHFQSPGPVFSALRPLTLTTRADLSRGPYDSSLYD